MYLKKLRSRFQDAVLVDGSFFKNVLYLTTGNGISILVTFISTPIIARLYSPALYGELALYISIVQSIGALATLQFTRTFILPKDQSEFKKLFLLTFFLLMIMSMILVFITIILHHLLLEKLKSPIARIWLHIIPISVFVFGVHDMVRGYNERNKNFKRLASGKIVSSVTSKITSLAYATLIQPAFWGLFISEFLIRPVEILIQLPRNLLIKIKNLRSGITKQALISTFKKYKTTPMYYLPAIWVINFSGQMPVYMLTLLYSSSVVGHFGMANSLLNIPLNLMVSSVAPVFTQRIAQESKNDIAQAQRLSQSMVKRVLTLSLIPNLVILLFSKQIFGYFLGKQWIEAGQMASFMSLYYVVLGLNSVYGLYLVFRKESLYLTVNCINLLMGALSIYLGYMIFHDVKFSVLFYSVAMLIGNLLHLFFCFRLLGLSAFKIIKIPLVIIIGMLFFQLIKIYYQI